MKYFLSILAFILLCQCRPKEEDTTTQFPGKPEVPSSIKKEHAHLLEEMHAMTLWTDSTGRAAIKLNELLQHHFKEEEDYALPPLGLLPLLSSGKLPQQSKEVVLLCEKLKSHLQHLDAEHQLIKAFIKELKQTAGAANHPEIIEFETALQKHANTEEEVFFPATILIGEYLKLKPQ